MALNSALRAVPPLLAFALTLLLTNEHAATLDFYSTAAQIIPVLVLVLAIEARAFHLVTMPGAGPRMSVLLEFSVMALGEFYALQPLRTGDVQDGHANWVMAAIVAGVVGVATVALLGSFSETGGAQGDGG